MIEMKQDEEAFEVYDPDWLYLRILPYTTGTHYDLGAPETLT